MDEELMKLGMGIEFDQTTVKQLDVVLKKVEQINQAFQQMGAKASTINPRIKDIDKQFDMVDRSVNKAENSVGKLIKTVQLGNDKTILSFRMADNSVQQYSKTLDETDHIITKHISTVKQFGDTFSSQITHAVDKMLSWGIAAGILYGTIRKINQAYRDMIALESEAVNIIKVLPSVVNLEELERGAIRLGKAFGQGVIETEIAMQSWARQYKETEEILRMTRASMLVSTVTDIGFEESVRSLSAIMAEWNYNTERSIHLVNTLNEIANNFRVTAEDLAEALAKTGSGAKVLGLNFETLTGIITTGIEALGLSGRQIGTMWSRTMARLIGTQAARSALERNLIDPNQNLSDIMDDLMIKWDYMTLAEKQHFAVTVAGTHHWAKLVGILDNYNTVLEATAASYFSAGSAQEEVNLMMQTTERHLGQLQASFHALVYENRSFADTVKFVAVFLRNVLDGLAAISKILPSHTLAITIATVALYKLTSAYIAAHAAAGGFNTAMWASLTLLNKFALIIAVVGGALYLLGLIASSTQKEIEKVQQETERLTEEFENHRAAIRGVHELAEQYEKLKAQIELAKEQGLDYSNTEEKFNIVRKHLIKQIADGNEELEKQLNMSNDLNKFYNNWINKELALANAIRRSTAESIQREIALLEAEKKRMMSTELKKYPLTGTMPIIASHLPPTIADAKRILEQKARIEGLEHQIKRLQERLKELSGDFTLEDILEKIFDTSNLSELLGDTSKALKIGFTDFTKEQILLIESMSLELQKALEQEMLSLNKEMIDQIEKGLRSPLLPFEREDFLYITPDFKALLIQADPNIKNYVEGLFQAINRELAKGELEVKNIEDAFTEVLEKSTDAWNNFLDSLRETPSVLEDIGRSVELFDKRLTNLTRVRESAIKEIAKVEARRAEITQIIDKITSLPPKVFEVMEKTPIYQDLVKEHQRLGEEIQLLNSTLQNIDFEINMTEITESFAAGIRDSVDKMITASYQRVMVAKRGFEQQDFVDRPLAEYEASKEVLRAYGAYSLAIQNTIQTMGMRLYTEKLTEEQAQILRINMEFLSKALDKVANEMLEWKMPDPREVFWESLNLDTSRFENIVEGVSGQDLAEMLGIPTEHTINSLETLGKQISSLNKDDLPGWTKEIIALYNALKKVREEQEELNKKIKGLEKTRSLIHVLTDSLIEMGGVIGDLAWIINQFIDSISINKLGKIEIDFTKIAEGFFTRAVKLLVDALVYERKEYEQDKIEGYKIYEAFKGFEAFEENQEKMRRLEEQLRNKQIEAAVAWALVGTFALTGNILGAIIATVAALKIEAQIRKIKEEIKKLDEELQKDLQNLLEVLGIAVENIANALGQALEATNYYDFMLNWGDNLYQITKQALIKAFLAQEAYQGLYENLSLVLTVASIEMFQTGMVQLSTIQAIKSAGDELARYMRSFYDVLGYLDILTPVGGAGVMERTQYTAGAIAPITYNIYASVHAGIFMGDENAAREVALYIGNIIAENENR